MDKLAILPIFGALYLLLSRSKDAREVFVTYFLPVLTLLPAYYETKLVPGIPEFSFWSSALLPVMVVWFVNEKLEGYTFSWIDVIIILHIVFIFYAQFEATGYKDAQKLVFRETLKRAIPFFMLKAVMLDPARRLQALKTIVILGAIVSFFMVYEFKFYHNLLDSFIRKLWPHWVPWDGTMSRYGFKRAAGSFAHPISAGYFFAMTAPIALWLWQGRYFKDQRLGLIVLGLNTLGVITSISRAPILGLAVSAVIIWFGWSRYKSLSGGFLAIVAVIGLAITVPKFVEYVSVSRAMAKTQDQENAAYRKEMLDNYIEVIKERPVWGYGRYTYPIVKGQKSIDNEYLFIAITAGMANLIVYLAILALVLVRLTIFAIKHSGSTPEGRLAWVLLAAWISAILTQATVYSGMQTTNYFFMIAAISEALILNGSARFVPEDTQPEPTKEIYYEYHFSRAL
jgi:O-antigen ligase